MPHGKAGGESFIKLPAR